MASPPGSPAGGGGGVPRPMSAMFRSNRSSSRMSVSSKHGGSRASDEDGKTSVKVAIRVRPPQKPGEPGYELVPQRFRGSTCDVPSPTNLQVQSAQGRKLFVFDRVFGEDVDQDGVWSYLNESVNHFVQGYNVSILAYGQSGAGKSYTMGTTGAKEQGDPSLMGVIPRAANVLFEQLAGSQHNGHRFAGSGIRAPNRYSGFPTNSKPVDDKSWQMKATYVEIYNEHLRDLLVPEHTPPSERSPVTIREDTKGRILLTGLQQVSITSIEDMLAALNFGSSIRQTDATAVNAKSSRSHAVFSLNLVQKRNRAAPTATKEKRRSVPIEAMSGSEGLVTVDSKLHFVDLAGSERLKNTGAYGDRAKEGISINAGLASLGKVISQLSTRSAGSYVSYRDSKLTRLLQDSLGGNAITYMVACINPAEFHLSETLNTVQYAQRARAIQSKPQIQQTSDDSDKQAVIERLRAEISFLRDQIRLSERAERKHAAPQERAERQNEREIEMQNQLLDLQENYSALGSRHAKLISEITKARDAKDEDTPMLKDTIGDSALDRLKRSNSFAEAVEQVVLEYEKTIQSLEGSLSTTRSSLSSTESTLLEKETKVAYMETVTQQLQARIQKSMDREANNENYVRDLEARVDGITSGEEKSSAMIQDLRKELHRVRENESNCEEYITTLEERLAEAEQDHEMMQREIDRLEHVVERQRSIGKLDNLLYELDHVRQADAKVEPEPLTNGLAKRSGETSTQTHSPASGVGEMPPHAEEEEEKAGAPQTTEPSGTPAAAESDQEGDEQEFHDAVPKALVPDKKTATEESPESPAQSKFVADKLENVTQELFDLRMEHETTVTDYEDLTRKYHMALNTLSELQDAVDEARHSNSTKELPSPASTRPTSFLADAGTNGLRPDGHPSSSRSLSSELSLAGESPTSTEPSEAETVQEHRHSRQGEKLPRKEGELAHELATLRRLNVEKEEMMARLNDTYAQLQDKHQDTLDYVEELKTEVQKAQMAARPPSPSRPVVRRKSSHNIMHTDRANRGFAALRNIALDQFEDEPDLIQSFEVNLHSIMTELHMRSERVQALEGEVASIRKEMEGKMTIITGLTRERSSLKGSSPLDISVVSSMRDQLLESGNQLRALQESHAARERELQAQIDSLKASLSTRSTPSTTTPGGFPETPTEEAENPTESGFNVSSEEAAALRRELDTLQSNHVSAMRSSKASEQQLLDTVNELQNSLREAEASHGHRISAMAKSDNAFAEMEEEMERHQEERRRLQHEIDEQKAKATTHANRVAELEQNYADIVRQAEESTTAREAAEEELESNRDLVSSLEQQIEEHKAALAQHEEELESLRESHSDEIDVLHTAAAAAQTEHDEKLASQLAGHRSAMSALEAQLAQARSSQDASTAAVQGELDRVRGEIVELVKGVSTALGRETDAGQVHAHVQALADARRDLLAQHERAAGALQAAQAELAAARADAQTLETNVGELRALNEETVKELERVSAKEKKSSRLVEELEDQLSSNYDQHQAATNRLSALQTERQVRVDEALHARGEMERELEECRARINHYESQLGDAKRFSNRESLDPRDANLQRSNSANSNLRKSTSHTSLPSPPPAIPLPPLPGSAPPTSGQANHPSSPPASRHQSKDLQHAQLVEDQEARIRTIEKHLFAEKQLTATLEEALTDLETSSTKVKGEMEGWKKKCGGLEEELAQMRRDRSTHRYSLQAVEEERNARMRVEAERANLEARMAALNQAGGGKKKKKSTLNCF